ncbi:MAG: hypothetical protein J7L82_03815, partial [Staphylothermus sp.]|nr:hypothetical protein [Staphylothermus sp.]
DKTVHQHTVFIPYINSVVSGLSLNGNVRRLRSKNYDIIVRLNKSPYLIEINSLSSSNVIYLIPLGIDSFNNVYKITPILIGPLTDSEKEYFYYKFRNIRILYYKFSSGNIAHFLTYKSLRNILNKPTNKTLNIFSNLFQEFILKCSPYNVHTEVFSRKIVGLAPKSLELHYKLVFREDIGLKIYLRISKNRTSLQLLRFNKLEPSLCKDSTNKLSLIEDLSSQLHKFVSSQKISGSFIDETIDKLSRILYVLYENNVLDIIISKCQKLLSENEPSKCIKLICTFLEKTGVKCIDNYNIVLQLINLFKNIRITEPESK